ncbi:hypothetical protein LUQ84_002718 [Hamiltosporidium tvaerminnensis]|nr:hypothetical protein LUQ84_002718 [Hamiltosporidium tvaerminnensis]KAK1348024.1 hypothetical protein LUQ84_002718 [Hamiltosporidium tvaerminnensis]
MQLKNFPLPRQTSNKPSPLKIKANLFPIKLPPTLIHHYTITFEPPLHKSLTHHIFTTIVINNPSLFPTPLAYDSNSILITANELPFKDKTIDFIYKKKDTNKLIITHKHTISLKDIGLGLDNSSKDMLDNSSKDMFDNKDSKDMLDNSSKDMLDNSSNNNNTNTNTNTSLAVQAFEIISRQHQLLTFISEGRKTYSSKFNTILSKGLQVFTGITHSLKLTLKGPLLNVDTAFSVFFEEISLLSFIVKTLSGRRSDKGNKYGKRYEGKKIKGDSREGDGKEGGVDIQLSREDENCLYNITPNTFKEVARVLKGVKMTTTHRERNFSFKICDITLTPASETFFEIRDNGGNDNGGNVGNGGNDNSGNEINNNNNNVINNNEINNNNNNNTTNPPTNNNTTNNNTTNNNTTNNTNTKHSVADYFASTYSTLKYPFLPCVVIKKRDKVLYLPIEVVRICSNQKYIRKLDESQTSEMIKIAALPPNIRFSIIKERIEDMNIFNNKIIKDFNIYYGKDFVEVKGRQLRVPDIQFGNKINNPVRGSWNLKGFTAVKPININEWAVLLLTDEEVRDINIYIDNLIRICNSFGVKLNKNYNIITCDSPKKYMEILSTGKYKFCIVVLKDRNSSVYGGVKKIAETVYCVVTQCIRRVNLEKCMDPTFCSNIAIKINAKLGGINYKLSSVGGGSGSGGYGGSSGYGGSRGSYNNSYRDGNNNSNTNSNNNSNTINNISTITSITSLFKGDTIVFGADVSHPGIGDLESPSIVAVVASLDTDLTSYTTIMRTQTRRQEIIENLKEIVREILIRFRSNSSVIPKRIIFFRDGVGESQFYSVFESEICSIKEACKSLDSKYEPEVIFIVAQKRHSIRFMIEDSSGEDSGNKGGDGDRGYSSSYKGDSSNYKGNSSSYKDNKPGNYKGNFKPRFTGNVLPGTCVDEVGHPLFFDFYLVSHYALQGTARPVRYQVLYDDSKLGVDLLQEYIHSMCYLYARATKAVSVVPPIYYAHLAAARAKCYIDNDNGGVIEMKKVCKGLENLLYYL